MVATAQSLREQVACACRILALEGYADLTLGHVSARATGSGTVHIKRKGVGLDETEPEDVISFELDDENALDSPEMHLEAVLHTEVYRARPDVVVLDISMPGMSGLEVTARLRSASPRTRVLILSMHDNAEYVLESVRAGAHGYLLKDTAATELREAIRTVCRGQSYFSPPVASRLTAAVRGSISNSSSPALTSEPSLNGICTR